MSQALHDARTPGGIELDEALYEATYAEERRALMVERSRWLLGFSIFFYPLWHFLDLILVPDKVSLFLTIRLAAVSFFVLCFAATFTAAGRRNIQGLALSYTLVAALGVVVFTASTQGFGSPYFVGLMLVLLAGCIVVPFHLQGAGVFCGVALAAYFGANTALHGPSLKMLPPLIFLAGTVTVALFIAGVNTVGRRRALRLRMQLENAYSELEALDAARTRFFASVSHELRTPLTLILGPVEEHLRAADLPPEVRSDLETVVGNARRLLRQVELLLDSAKVEAGRMRCRPRAGRLDELLTAMVDAVRPHAARLGLEVRTHLPALPETAFDPEQLETVVANLLSNALKFTPRGGRLELRGEALSDGGVAFELEDTGIGIPADQLTRVFERFHQVDGTDTRPAEGTGLGLALARELVELHGGTLGAQSAVGEGTTFRVELPARPPAVLEGADRAAPSPARIVPNTRLADVETPEAPPPPAVLGDPAAPRILVVEDNPELRALLLRRLAARYRVEGAADGEAGFAAANLRPPELIVADVMMPIMDGLELTRRVRADPILSSVPVLLLTARGETSDVVGGLGVGADDYIVKPFRMDELEARVAAHLRARTAERALRERDSRLAAIGLMTSSVAHDLRNPLTTVMCLTSEARHAAAEQGLTEATSDLDRSLRELQRVVEMVRDVVRFASGVDTQARTEPTALVPFVQETLAPLRARFTDTRLTLEDDCGAEVTVGLDPGLMRRVLENLLLNAQEALAEQADDRWIRVSVDADDTSARVRVRDGGPGIPPEALPTLFQPLIGSHKPGGSGLGLSIVRNFVKLQGGDVRLEASDGGACFCITLPRRRSVRPTARSPQASIPRAGERRRILVVDDERPNLDLYHRILSKDGHLVATAASGKAALELIASGCLFDLVITDLHMPELDGRELYETLVREHPDMSDRVVFATGESPIPVETRDLLSQAGNVVLTKPFAARELRATVSGILSEPARS